MRLTTTSQVLNNVVEGVSYGYPDCCILHFHLRQVNGTMHEGRDSEHHHNGTGFICCPTCNSNKNAFQIHIEIAGNRVYKNPFPYGNEEQDIHPSDMPKEALERIQMLVPTIIHQYNVIADEQLINDM